MNGRTINRRSKMKKKDDNHVTTRGSKSAQAIRAIRELITAGEIQQGELLSEEVLIEKLAKSIKVSRMPVRQAISFFESQGIMEVIPKKGTFVRKLEPREIKEVWASRVAIEELILIQLACKLRRDLKGAENLQREMAELAKQCKNDGPSPDERAKFVRLDERFHEELAFAAGYPRLAEELNALRFKLRYAARGTPISSKYRMSDIVGEHENILAALRGEREGVQPDINQVRLAFRVHMRNSGRYSWGIADIVGRDEDGDIIYGTVFDLPDVSRRASDGMARPVPISYLFSLRLATELCAVRVLAANPGVNLASVKVLLDEMRELAKRTMKGGRLPSELETRFINLDIGFHGGLCRLGGMLFGEEVVSYVWHDVHNIKKYKPRIRDLDRVIRQHHAVLSAIEFSQGTVEDIKRATDAVEDHLFGAFIMNNSDKPMQEEMARQFHAWARQIEDGPKQTV